MYMYLYMTIYIYMTKIYVIHMTIYDKDKTTEVHIHTEQFYRPHVANTKMSLEDTMKEYLHDI